jgi:hypothetical protein
MYCGVVRLVDVRVDTESVRDMCKAADEELRRRYGTNMSTKQVCLLLCVDVWCVISSASGVALEIARQCSQKV